MNKILVLGASGMLGNTIFRLLSNSRLGHIKGTVRSRSSLRYFPYDYADNLISAIDVENIDTLIQLLSIERPNVVINCIGLIKQYSDSKDPLHALPLNALFPHRLAHLCSAIDARLIHISTDCVFSGKNGNYCEEDFPDADDLYGRSKYIGEVGYKNTVTLRTSIIGHELNGNTSLLEWSLAQTEPVKGFNKAIFSGMPTVELARIIRDYVMINPELSGLYHVSVDPISKFELLRLISEIYRKNITITPDESLVIDRSLNSSRFRLATGFSPKSWRDLIQAMHEFR